MGYVRIFEYRSQSEDGYEVLTENGELLQIPKNRAKFETYPKPVSAELKMLYKFLAWSALGLLTSGVLTVLIYPAIYINSRKVIENELIEARNIFLSATVLFGIGVVLTVILLIRVFSI